MFLRKPFRYTFFKATLWLIAINAVVFFLTDFVSIKFKINEYPYYYYLSLKEVLSANYIFVRYFKFLWQPFSYMFVHGNLTHLLFNMLTLFFFGITVEKAIGSKEFILFYLLCGLLDGIISILIYAATGTYVWLMGASGAIYAVLFAYAVIFPRNRIYIWGIIPVPAPLLVLGYAALEFLSQISPNISDNVAHLTHLTGFALAWLYLWIRMGVHPIKVWKNAYFS